MLTTLNNIRNHQPCLPSWEKLLAYLGKVQADDEPLLITTILKSNGIRDAAWCIRADTIKGMEKEMKLFAADCAESVLHVFENEYADDKRPRLAIDTLRNHVKGFATREELIDATFQAYQAYFSVSKQHEIAYCAYLAAYYETPFYCVATAIDSGAADLDFLNSLLLKYLS
jgi:hypothetical protein